MISSPTPAPSANPAAAKVLIADDSAVIRGLIQRILATDRDIEVVGLAANGEAAVQLLRLKDVSVVVLDIEMPIMDGLTALPRLLAVDPGVQVIVASTLTQRNAEISLKALDLGAADYIPKPSSPRDIAADGAFSRELLAKIKALAVRRRLRPRADVPPSEGARPRVVPAAAPGRAHPPILLRKAGATRPGVLAVGSSTGGPQALFSLFRALPRPLGVPVVVTQHMPPTFTKVLADHIGRNCGHPCGEAMDGETLVAGRVYLAPGDWHLLVDRDGATLKARLTQDAPENHCRPAVDPMLRSLARALGGSVLAVILTGMGADGLAGSRIVVESGGTVFAQDEASSVVWGMPGAVATAGLCAAVAPIPELATQVAQMVGRDAS